MSSPNQPIPNGSTGFTLPPARLQIPGQSGGPGTGLLGDLFAQFFNNLLTAGTGISIAVVDGVIQISTSGGGGGVVVQSAITDISSAELLSLAENPITIAPAPGAGNVIIPLSIFANYIFGTNPYVIGSGSLWTNIGPVVEIQELNALGFLDQSSNQNQSVPIEDTIESSDAIINTAMTLSNIGDDFTEGDGTMKVIVYYLIQSGVV
jgi:hypothetical protein